MQDEETTRVVILTRSFRVHGMISLLPGARLTDFVTDSKVFFAVTDAEVQDHAGNPLLRTQFLNVNREQVEIILPSGVLPTSGQQADDLGFADSETLLGER